LRRRAYLRNKLFDSVLTPTTSNSYHFSNGNSKNEKNYTLLSNQNEIKKGIVCEKEKSKIQVKFKFFLLKKQFTYLIEENCFYILRSHVIKAL
jgi:hypothetical protein